MLNILKMIIIIIILLIIILLTTGIKISIKYTKKESEIKGCLKILILKKIPIYTTKFPDEKDKDKNTEKKHKKHNMKKIYHLLKPCLKDILTYLKTILKTMKIKQIENHIIFGMESYTDTGKYIGIIWAILSIINSINKNIKISAEPTFTESKLDAKGKNEIEIYPLKLLIPTLKLLTKKQIIKLIKGVIDER